MSLDKTWKQIKRIERERDTACSILERLAERLGNEDTFDGDWYSYENLVMEDLKSFGKVAWVNKDYKKGGAK